MKTKIFVKSIGVSPIYNYSSQRSSSAPLYQRINIFFKQIWYFEYSRKSLFFPCKNDYSLEKKILKFGNSILQISFCQRSPLTMVSFMTARVDSFGCMTLEWQIGHHNSFFPLQILLHYLFHVSYKFMYQIIMIKKTMEF